MIPQRLGHYEIVAKLGAGGMGDVYRARDTRLERDVAIKVLPVAALSDELARARFRKEALALARLNHPNIATVFDFNAQEGMDFLVMELVSGESLAQKRDDGPLAAKDVAALGAQVASALEEAHERGIIHRDLKPGNILVTAKGHAKVLDFGLARLLRPGADDVTMSLSEPHVVAGTVPYMAPEQLRGQPADARTDIWALGVVLYEMAAGSRPFQGETGFALSAAIINQPPPALPLHVPPWLRAVIERCLAKDPDRRYQRAGEVRAALEPLQIAAADPPRAGWQFHVMRRRGVVAAAGVALFGVLVFTSDLGGLRSRLTGAPSERKIESLAVLPLENDSGNPAHDYFADGMTETLITDLARLDGLKRVTARGSVARFKKTKRPLREIAGELNVNALLTGAVALAGSRVRISVQLIDAATESPIWTDRYERDFADVLALQNEIVSAVVRELRLELAPGEKARLASARPVNPEAYEAYLRGMYYANQFMPEGFEKAFAYLRDAIQKDPAHPLPYAYLALALNSFGHGVAPPPGVFPEAKAAALKALELDPTLAEAHAALAEIQVVYEWDWQGAGQAFRRAVENKPNVAQSRRWYSWYLLAVGRKEEALAEARRIAELEPLTPLYTAFRAWFYFAMEDYDRAIQEAQKSLELNPNLPYGLYALGCAYARKGMFQESAAAHERAAAVSPFWKWGLGITHAMAGRKEEAREIAAELEKGSLLPSASSKLVEDFARSHAEGRAPTLVLKGYKRTPAGLAVINPWGLAEIYATLGEKEKAIRWLEAGIDQRQSWMPFMGRNPNFEPLRGHLGFQSLLRMMNLPL